jgi:hypothetical protein
MAAMRGSFPHPVLDDSDDVGSFIEALNVAVTPSISDVEVRYEVRSDDPDLWDLILRGVARHSLRWTCTATVATEEVIPTLERNVYQGVGLISTIDQRAIRGTVNAEVRVVAAERIAEHRWSRQHEDYGDAVFAIEPGDVIAVCGVFSFDAQKSYDPMRPPVGSCFRFSEKQVHRPGLEIAFDSDEFVEVMLPTDAFNQLRQLAAQPELQIAVVVLPALMRTIEFLKEAVGDPEGEDLSERLWYRAIVELIEQHGSIDDSALTLAQRILDNPAEKGLSAAVALDLAEEDE